MSLQDSGPGGVSPELLSLDSSLPGFLEDLRRLDRLPSRNCDSAFVFYMRAGQKTAAEVRLTCLSHLSVSPVCLLTVKVPPTCLSCLIVDPTQRRVQQQRLTSLPGLPGISWSACGGGASTGVTWRVQRTEVYFEVCRRSYRNHLHRPIIILTFITITTQ